MSINYETLEGQAEALSGVVKLLHYMITEKDGGNYNPAKLDDESADLVNVFKDTFYRKVRKVKAETFGLEIEVMRSEKDGTVVVFMDTPSLPEDSEGPRLRVYLNEEPVWENPAYKAIDQQAKGFRPFPDRRK